MASPGFLIQLHPMLTRYKDLKYEWENLLKDPTVKENPVIEGWKTKNPHPEGWKEGNYITNINLAPAIKRFGGEGSRIKAKVLAIDYKVDDAEYLKTLLTTAYSKLGHISGQLVPHGIHLLEGSETYKNLLQGQNQFTNKHTALVVEGLTEKELG
eukprot:15361716-Ditylum_brightwellii.AAC.1